jgi:hypothetical protein
MLMSAKAPREPAGALCRATVQRVQMPKKDILGVGLILAFAVALTALAIAAFV